MSDVATLPPIVTAIRESRRALARLLTRIENHAAASELAALYPFGGKAHLIGVTGAPGTGKSSLVNWMAKAYRAEGKTVSILAVDPTSPFSGGAVLGDRIRMRDLHGDSGVFIRSMATRGNLGGIARTTKDMIRALDAAGFDIVLIETVGAGQSEVEIASAAQTVIVVEAPGLGDDVQAIKAGILEIADILVVNKADNPGVESTLRALRAALDLGHRVERVMHHGKLMDVPAVPVIGEDSAWQTPILQTIATNGTGVSELLTKIAEHRAYLQESGVQRLRERASISAEIEERLRDLLLARLIERVGAAHVQATIERVLRREIDPNSAAQALLADSG
ncbi:MAG: methylmalonyl Co-A mutase-associated GTPase MeaB [Anaerolineae bacterium]|nr:methylmalonyl Co-A mutase-associated GTPase MeaB [Anaerolineae bacterium]MDW8298339.1 methylmalonyl Co-A mutase-associated GTPase MeaB [Anaerolineae bacterium]